jgi:Peptidase family M28
MSRSFRGIVILLFVINSIESKSQSPAVINIAQSCSQPALRSNLYLLASDSFEGRLMGSHGDTLASNFVASQFKKAGLTAPYNGSYFQTITATQKSLNAEFTIGNSRHALYDGWTFFPQNNQKLENIPVIFNSFSTIPAISAYIANNDVKGKAITVTQSLMLKIAAMNIDSAEEAWKAKGIMAVLWFGARTKQRIDYLKQHDFLPPFVNPLLDPVFLPSGGADVGLPEVILAPSMLNELLAEDKLSVTDQGGFADSTMQPVVLKKRINLTVKTDLKEVKAPNVIGVLKGSDPSLPCVVLSAHHDHDGKSGNVVFYGAVDNASGTVAIMEIAQLLKKAREKGLKPKRTIVFASFTGEERGELGSSWYVEHPLIPLNKTYGVLNIDMMGRVDTFYSGRRADSNYAYFLVKDSLHQFRSSLMSANKALKTLTLDPHYEDPRYSQRRLEGSDQFPFYLKGVPFVRIDCGFAVDYHQPTDTPDKINYDLLTKQVQLAFLTLWNMANE